MQVIVIHGGDEFANEFEFLCSLFSRRLSFTFPKRKEKRWKTELQSDLGSEYEVILPRLPHPYNAKYPEWKREFEELFPQLEEEVILIGHSLGGIFLAKYLSEEHFPKKICAVFLVAPVYDTDGERKIVQFKLPDSLAAFEEQVGQIFLYHSKDDPVVVFSELAKYQKALPSAQVQVFTDRQHFNQAHFPEIVADIKTL